MRIQKLRLKNFRCFENEVFTFDNPFIVIEGGNGSGKTSLLEALHYVCYLRSFRTRTGKELVSFDRDHFFIQVDIEEKLGLQNVQVGLSGGNKVVKLNQKAISSYKELIKHYQIIAATEDDLFLIKGAPEVRRCFLNQALAIEEEGFISEFRQYKQILRNRNSLLFKSQHTGLPDDILVWTRQLWEKSRKIQKSREVYLHELEKTVKELLSNYFSNEEFGVAISYKPKVKLGEKFEFFWEEYKQVGINEEVRYGRSLFGVHLDDFSINFRYKKAKLYASRGQQKLVVFLIKVAESQILKTKGASACLLFDDFLTDLDETVFLKCMKILVDLDRQVFLTCPLKSFITSKNIKDFDPKVISL